MSKLFNHGVSAAIKHLSGDDLLAIIGLEKRRTFFGAVLPSLAFIAAGVVLGAVAAVIAKRFSEPPALPGGPTLPA